jgi:hypothetical protein
LVYSSGGSWLNTWNAAGRADGNELAAVFSASAGVALVRLYRTHHLSYFQLRGGWTLTPLASI